MRHALWKSLPLPIFVCTAVARQIHSAHSCRTSTGEFTSLGLNVFVINSMANDVPMIETFKRVLPFFLSDAVRFAIIIAFPAIEMFLPRSPEIS